MRWFKIIAKKLIHNLFVFCQLLGIDVLPRHFYSEIPNIRKLRRTTDWRKKYSMRAVAGANCDQQLTFVRQITASNIPEHVSVYESACLDNREMGYGPIEAE